MTETRRRQKEKKLLLLTHVRGYKIYSFRANDNMTTNSQNEQAGTVASL